MVRFGIDFGTTRTVVAAVDEGRYPVASFDHEGRYVDYLPGYAAIDREGSPCFGDEARRRMADRHSLAVDLTANALQLIVLEPSGS